MALQAPGKLPAAGSALDQEIPIQPITTNDITSTQELLQCVAARRMQIHPRHCVTSESASRIWPNAHYLRTLPTTHTLNHTMRSVTMQNAGNFLVYMATLYTPYYEVN